jgi:glycosyltransferase involved in cell wall biosynthesis
MHIVHVLDRHYELTGYEVTYLSREQAKLGYRVTVVASDEYVELNGKKRIRAGEYHHDGCTIVRLPSFRAVGSRLWLHGLERELLRLKPDMIHCHGTFDLTSVRTARTRPRLHATLVCDCHAAAFNTNATGALQRFCYFLFRITAGKTLKKQCATISAIGEDEREFVCRGLGLAPSEVPIVRLGVDTVAFQQVPSGRESIRRSLHLDGSDILLLHVGNLRPGKRLSMLIAALEKLRPTNPHVRLMIIGSGAQQSIDEINREIAVRGLADKARLQPFAAHSALPDYYSAADIAVWPGDTSISVLEAMACGLPLIAPDTPYNRALGGEAGAHLFPMGDANALADAIRRLSSDHELRLKSGASARNHMVAEFDWKLVAVRHIEAYKNAARRQSKELHVASCPECEPSDQDEAP